jgi:hypothetical protein
MGLRNRHILSRTRRSYHHGSRRPHRLGLSRRRDCWPLGNSGSLIFSLLYGLENVTGLRYPRPVNLLLWFAVYLRRTRTIFAAAAVDVLAHTFSFVALQRTGVRLLFGHADVRQGIKNRPALYFQLAR